MATLIIYEESDTDDTVFESYDLTDTSVLIGSDEENHLILDTPDIDPSHASLELRDGHWVLQDLGGPGGTVVNGETIEGPFTLYHGDLIELNYVKMKFQDHQRGPTTEFPREADGDDFVEMEGVDDEDLAEEPLIKGRVWFAVVAGVTGLIIVVILLFIIAAGWLGIFSFADFLP